MRLKKWQWVVVSVFVILMVTNPSMQSFKDFIGYRINEKQSRNGFSDNEASKEFNFFMVYIAISNLKQEQLY